MLIQCIQCKRRFKLSDLKLDLLRASSAALQCPNCKNAFTFPGSATLDHRELINEKQGQYFSDKTDIASNDSKREKLIEQFILLRILVGFLGEKQQFGWWDTDFLSSTGIKFLEVTFPRSVFSAAITSVTKAAKRVHDIRIGRGHIFHLFRLPLPLEQQIYEHLRTYKTEVIMTDIANTNSALNTLKSMGNGVPHLAEGPTQAGIESDLYKAHPIKLMAKLYVNAFENSKEIYPYFVG